MTRKDTTAVVIVALLAVGGLSFAGPAVLAQQDGGETVEADRLEVGSLELRNVTVEDAVVREMTVREADGEGNETLQNVSISQLHVEGATMTSVVFENVTIRDEGLATDLGFSRQPSNATNQSVSEVLIENRTLSGVVFDSVTVENATELEVSANVTDGDVSTDDSGAVFAAGNVTVENVASANVETGAQSGADGGTETDESDDQSAGDDESETTTA